MIQAGSCRALSQFWLDDNKCNGQRCCVCNGGARGEPAAATQEEPAVAQHKCLQVRAAPCVHVGWSDATVLRGWSAAVLGP